MIKHFINLTNGIEALLYNAPDGIGFIRIQSTACEQKRWDFILQDLDNNFLMWLAIGAECVVIDFGANKNVPRAIYQGLEFVRYVLNRRWLGLAIKPIVRGNNVSEYFSEQYDKLSDSTLKKLDYFKKFLLCHEIKLSSIASETCHDGQYEYYKEIIRNNLMKPFMVNLNKNIPELTFADQ